MKIGGLFDPDGDDNENYINSKNQINRFRKTWYAHHGGRRTVPTFVIAHIFCASEGSRVRRERNTSRRTRGLVLSPVSLGGSSYFLRKRLVVFQQMANNFDLLLSVL